MGRYTKTQDFPAGVEFYIDFSELPYKPHSTHYKQPDSFHWFDEATGQSMEISHRYYSNGGFHQSFGFFIKFDDPATAKKVYAKPGAAIWCRTVPPST